MEGISLPYRVFDPAQQRITHATITVSKRLSEMLTWIMAEQQAGPSQIGPIGKQRSRYTPTGKRPQNRKSWLDKRTERWAAEAKPVE